MKISVTTTNWTLASLLSSAQVWIIRESSDKKTFKDLFIHNNHATVSIYIEMWWVASESESFEIIPWDSISFQEWNLDDVNLISIWATNDDIRILAN